MRWPDFYSTIWFNACISCTKDVTVAMAKAADALMCRAAERRALFNNLAEHYEEQAEKA